MSRFIDAHSHIWTPDTAHYPLAAGFRRSEMQPASFTVEELCQQMEPAGVDRVVLIQMSFYGYDNSYMLSAIARHPKKFVGVAVIDQDHPGHGAPDIPAEGKEPGRPNAAVTMKRLKQAGVRGFRIFPKNQPVERWLDNAGLRAMFATGASENLAMCCLIDANALPALSRMCTEFPETPVVIDHLSRIGIGNQFRPEDLRALCGMAKHKQVSVKVSAFYALGKAQPPYTDLAPLIRQVYDAFGPERLMWATDCPFQAVAPHTYQHSLDLVRKHLDFLTPQDKEWLLRKTAERVFFHS